ncbi:hypothetical protein DERF_009787 [Dermatophagoides farinae]|uniref:Uncharacterized protein n=1 Tax=Dermatophagoides farinae TaxID=6954 RepID=A0A922HYP2_DERFA|nr:hypothetical protein DERF_009787 [Dermatophagoides farinae]
MMMNESCDNDHTDKNGYRFCQQSFQTYIYVHRLFDVNIISIHAFIHLYSIINFIKMLCQLFNRKCRTSELFLRKFTMMEDI